MLVPSFFTYASVRPYLSLGRAMGRSRWRRRFRVGSGDEHVLASVGVALPFVGLGCVELDEADVAPVLEDDRVAVEDARDGCLREVPRASAAGEREDEEGYEGKNPQTHVHESGTGWTTPSGGFGLVLAQKNSQRRRSAAGMNAPIAKKSEVRNAVA